MRRSFSSHACGLAVYDPLSSPTTLANDKTTKGAHETLFALAGNFEEPSFGILWGSYLRFVRGATESATSLDRYDEGILVVRPQWYVTDHIGIAVEGSYQARMPRIARRKTDGHSRRPMLRGAVLLLLADGARIVRATADRSRLRGIDAQRRRRTLYPRDDPFSWRSTEHYLGSPSWWFNMSSYP